jgi:hypothetical protein
MDGAPLFVNRNRRGLSPFWQWGDEAQAGTTYQVGQFSPRGQAGLLDNATGCRSLL